MASYTPTGQTGTHPNDKNYMGSDEAILSRVRALRANRGLPPDDASDQIWLRRIKSGGADVFGQARTAIERKAASFSQPPSTSKPKPGPQHPNDPTPVPGTNIPGNTSPAPDFAKTAPKLFPYLPKPILDLFIAEYAKNGGSVELAVQTVRQDPVYETYYPGNKRDDGTVRHNEQDYARQVDGYRQVLSYYDIPAEMFKARFGELVAGEVTAAQFQQRADQMYVSVMSRSDDLRSWYAENYGIEASDAALLASAIDPKKSVPELMMEISRTQIGGAAKESGFGVDLTEATRLQQAGLTEESAKNFYRKARGMVPTLDEAMRRNNDPDDEFTIDEYTDALIFSDPSQMRQLQRNVMQDRSRFTGQGGVVSEDGRMVGLGER